MFSRISLAAAGRSPVFVNTVVRATVARSVFMKRNFHASVARLDDLPYHLVVGLPALSPTMESGALAEWYVSEGDAISAGDAVAKIETDKASIDFEAQDDVYVAKLLKSAGDGADIPVGTPIMITVEDEADVAAFKDYVHTGETASPSAATPDPTPSPPPPQAASEPVKETAAPPPPPSPSVTEPAKPPPADIPATPVAAASISSGDGQSVTIPWARPLSSKSPLSKLLEKQQMAYMELYGTTGQKVAVKEDS
jgi:pyruvate dehydrogenase E2 component (dihydrolipoamide acetyltransferase)